MQVKNCSEKLYGTVGPQCVLAYSIAGPQYVLALNLIMSDMAR